MKTTRIRASAVSAASVQRCQSGLLVSKSNERIDAHRAARRQLTGEQRNQNQHDRGDDERGRIARNTLLIEASEHSTAATAAIASR